MKTALVSVPSGNIVNSSLGLGYISAYLESKGFESSIFDAHFHSWSEDRLIREVTSYKPDLIGFTLFTPQVLTTHHLAARIKAILGDVPIVVGGGHVSALPKETLEEFPNFTYGVVGEGEETMSELVRCLSKGENAAELGQIKSLAYRSTGGEIKLNSPRNRLSSSELSSLPFPKMKHYYPNNTSLRGKHLFYPMVTSRGCPYACIFCKSIFGKEVRMRSPNSIVSEMEYAIKEYGAHTIRFYDETFFLDEQAAYATFELIRERGLHKLVNWDAQTRTNLVHAKLLKSAKEVGCKSLMIGMESGSNEILKMINKQTTAQEIKEAAKMIKQAGIRVHANFILGLPGETAETIGSTIDLAVSVNPDTAYVSLLNPLPGTVVYEMAREGKGGFKRTRVDDWLLYDRFGNRPLEMESMSVRELMTWRKKLMLSVYLKNSRPLNLLRTTVQYWKKIIQ